MSHSTVSRALRESPLVNEQTRERIQRLAREMGYTPNAVAQSLQTQRTHAIGLVVTSIGDPFFSDVVKGVEDVARRAGLSVFLNSSHNDPEQEIEVIEMFHRRRVDGILVASSRIGRDHADRLARIHVPVVLMNSQAESRYEDLHSVSVDDRAGARMAVDHLVDLGHRRIGYLGARNRPLSNRRRLDGYLAALRAAGIAERDDWICIADPHAEGSDGDVEAGQVAARILLERTVSAIFCFNDMTAVGVQLACREAGLCVPEDLSVVGFDDIALARYVHPPLTTVNQPKLQLGKLAMKMMCDLIEGRSVDRVMLAPSLVKRDTSAPPGGTGDAGPLERERNAKGSAT